VKRSRVDDEPLQEGDSTGEVADDGETSSSETTTTTEDESSDSPSGQGKSGRLPVRRRTAKYNPAWEADYPFLEKGGRFHQESCEVRPFCSLCSLIINGDKWGVNRHASSMTHKKAVEARVKQPNLHAYLREGDPEAAAKAMDAASCEVKLCAFMVDHDMPFRPMDHMSDLIKEFKGKLSSLEISFIFFFSEDHVFPCTNK
jgi:hypothetical protein